MEPSHKGVLSLVFSLILHVMVMSMKTNKESSDGHH